MLRRPINCRVLAACSLVAALLAAGCGSGPSDEDIEALVAERVEAALAERPATAETTTSTTVPPPSEPPSTTTTAADAESGVPDGSRHAPHPFSCPDPGSARKSLRDGWHNVAAMHADCIGFRLASSTSGGDCVFGVPSGRADKEAIKQGVNSWTKGVTDRNVGSVIFWRTVPIKFDNCQMVKPERVRISELRPRVSDERYRARSSATTF